VDIRKIANLAYTPPDTGFPDRVKEKIDGVVYGTYAKIWRGMVKVAASGFGKGVLLTAAIAIGGAAVAWGYMAEAGSLGAGATIDTGIMHGATKAIGFLLSGFGAATLAVGGALGAVADMWKHHNRISEEVAYMQAKQFTQARSGNISKDKQYALDVDAERRFGNRNEHATSAHANGYVVNEPQCDSFCQQEEQRRADRDIATRAV
jgi:hypothetical protein